MLSRVVCKYRNIGNRVVLHQNHVRRSCRQCPVEAHRMPVLLRSCFHEQGCASLMRHLPGPQMPLLLWLRLLLVLDARPETPPGDESARGARLHNVQHLRRAVRIRCRRRQDHRPLVRVVRGRYSRYVPQLLHHSSAGMCAPQHVCSITIVVRSVFSRMFIALPGDPRRQGGRLGKPTANLTKIKIVAFSRGDMMTMQISDDAHVWKSPLKKGRYLQLLSNVAIFSHTVMYDGDLPAAIVPDRDCHYCLLWFFRHVPIRACELSRSYT